MAPYQAVAVAVRVFAAWLGIYVLRTAASFVFTPSREVPGFGVAATIVALTGVLVALLWFFPGSIARKILSAENATADSLASPDLWLSMGCALLGLWMLISAVPSLVLDGEEVARHARREHCARTARDLGRRMAAQDHR